MMEERKHQRKTGEKNERLRTASRIPIDSQVFRTRSDEPILKCRTGCGNRVPEAETAPGTRKSRQNNFSLDGTIKSQCLF